MAGQLGIMKAGAGYPPIGVDYPTDRVAYMLEDSGARVLLTQSAHLKELEGALGRVEHLLVMDEGASAAAIPESLRERVVMPSGIYVDRPDVALPAGSPDDLAYMIYTSGSTGNPNGAKITHRNIVNFLTWVKEELGITAAERLAFVTSYAFDMTMTSNWTPFLVGASLHVLSEEKTKDVNNLLRFISEKGITFLNITPSHFSLLSSAREFLADADIPLPESMRVMLGGEVISTKDLNQWLKFYPGHRFINEYGPPRRPWPRRTQVRSTRTIRWICCGAHRQAVYNTQIYIRTASASIACPACPASCTSAAWA
ncbi:MAG: AMP-binding protein [Bilophila wadsworthia]